ncbi:hypothetical protein [Psittacicella hinzii]|uniref:Uncharacterized protein n=1 Tax=Psittacicella hinzii TaxID=2028575 RepID=A0A3A1YF78_9GAMM|nr:hypothetical protein [Psittacicella hinzii]RIY34687.1 hypothetical protein CKF58_07880 [Psittacicella hinzii]
MSKKDFEQQDNQRVQQLVEAYAHPTLTPYQVQHQAQVNALVNYYRELIPAVRAFIKRANQPEARESVKISEGVLNNLKYGVLLNPLATFASHFDPDETTEQRSALLRLYIDLEEVYNYLYTTRDWVNEQQHLDMFVARHDPELIELVLNQMYSYLNSVLQNMFNIYSYAVGYYYGTDSDSEGFSYKTLMPTAPHILEWSIMSFRGINFMYFFVIASQIYYQPQSYYAPLKYF